MLKAATDAAARGALRLLPHGLVVRVPFGPMRGMRWMPESAPHAAWLGRLEREQLELFIARIGADSVVWDVGANVGLYTIPAARAAAPAGVVYAFEPLPRNARYLRDHVAMNALANVHVVEAAVSDTAGMVRMSPGESPSEGYLTPDGSIPVTAIALDRWRADTGAPQPSIVKIDVEGNEHRVVAGALATIEAARPLLFISLHGVLQADSCRSTLRALGYRISSWRRDTTVDASTEWLAEPATAA